MTLFDLIARIDSSVRLASVEAHRRTLANVAKQPAAFDDRVPTDALLPRAWLEPDRLELELPVRVSGDEVSLRARGARGRDGILKVRWRRTSAPEATALVRTAAELQLSRRIDDGGV